MQITTQGLRELDRALAELPKATQRRVLVRVLKEQAGEMVQDAKNRAPFRFGDLWESITVSERRPAGYSDAGTIAYSGVLRGGGTQAEAVTALRSARRANPNEFARVWVGPGRHPQAITQEFGTYFHPPQPFMRPAWDETRPRMLRGISTALRREIDRAVARLAKRAARQAGGR
jgi:HK97 gp10 family phage protein